MDYQNAEMIFKALYQDINGYTISNQARENEGSNDRVFVYGEVTPDAFSHILKEIEPNIQGNFYDLGSGTGKAVILAALLGEFDRCRGVELLPELCEASRGVLARYNNEFVKHLQKNKHPQIEFLQDDFLKYDFSDADVIFVHSTCYSDWIWMKLIERFEQLKPGTYVIAVSKTIPSLEFQLIKTRQYNMGWGKGTVNFYLKK